MANTPRKIRIPRPVYPWSDVANQFDDPVQLYVNRVLQDLERLKLEIATVNATGGVYGDILVADVNRVFQPQKYVPLNLGVGLSANPTYRFQAQDGEVNFHFTQSASGGAYGITLGRAASGTSHLAYMFASGDVVLWEIGFDPGGNLILRSQLNATNVLVSDVSGDIIIRRNLDVGRNLTATGDTVLFGNVTTGPLTANTLQVTGTSFLFGTTTTGPLTANSLSTSGDITVGRNASVAGSGSVVGALAVSGDLTNHGVRYPTPTAGDNQRFLQYDDVSKTVRLTSVAAVSGSFTPSYVTVTGNYTLLLTDYLVLVAASGGVVTLTLPNAAALAGINYVIKKIDSSGNTVTINPAAGQTIDGASSLTISSQYTAYALMSNGSAWWIV